MDRDPSWMSRSGVRPSSTTRDAGAGWGRVSLMGLAIWVCAVVGFAVVPDRAISYLSPRVSPVVRDLLVLLVFGSALVLVSWLFVRLQNRRTG